jgi:hypothetical protein
MMMALGCIQALECNKNICPTGVATQNPDLIKGLDINNKAKRVSKYHRETIKSVIDLLSATGHDSLDMIERNDIYRRINQEKVKKLNEIYPNIQLGSFLKGEIPHNLINDFTIANENSFLPKK